MTSPTALFRLLGLALLTSLPALAQSVTATVTAATQLVVTAGTNSSTRPAGTNLSAGLNLGASYQSGPIFVTVNSVFGLSTTSSSITHTIQESMTGVNATRTAGPHATLLTLTASQPVRGTLIVQYSPGTVSGGSSTASIDVQNDGTVEWTRAPGTTPQTFQLPVTVSGSLVVRLMTSMNSTNHSLSVQFANWSPLAQLPLQNPGFENGLASWTEVGYVFGGQVTAPRTGTGACFLWDLAPVRPNVSQTFAASAGTYALHCYGKCSSSPGGDVAQARVEFFDLFGAMIGSAATTVLDDSTPTGIWVGSETLMATAPSGTVAGRVTLSGFFGNSVQCFFDDVSLARVEGCGAFELPIAGTPSMQFFGSYFTLDVTTPHGVRVCGLDLQPRAAAGTAVDATVYLHRSLTDASQLTTYAQASAANWCAIATLHGVSNGFGVMTPFGITNATDSLQLPPGQYLLAILRDVGATERFDFVPASSLTVADPGSNLAVETGGSLLTGFGFGAFSPVAGYLPGALHYEILSAPTTPTTCAAEGVAVGTGCGGEPNMVYEVFAFPGWDLQSSDVIVTGNGTGASLSTAPATALVPPVGPPVAINGGVSAPIPLGFDLGAFGLPNVSDLRVGDGYGSIFFGGVGNTAATTLQAAAGLVSNDSVARLDACLAGWAPAFVTLTAYVDVTPGVQAVVTVEADDIQGYLYVLQAVITPTAMRVRYNPSPHPTAGLVGFHNGIPLPAPPSVGRVDLTAGPSPFTSPNARADLDLSAQNRPLLGTNFDVTLAHNPLIAAVYLDINPLGTGLPLPTPLFAPFCNLYVSLNAAVWSVTVAPTSTSSIPIPLDTTILGLAFGVQGIGLLPDTLITSNGLAGLVGDF